MPCLVGCGEDYCCGQVVLPIEGNSLAPFVKLFFCNEKKEQVITVGNQSAPQWGNSAVIKSFQIGSSNGLGVKVEIMDELGGSFSLFVSKLNKCMKAADKEYTMGVQWGWIVGDCDEAHRVISSPPVYTIPVHLDVDMSGGKVKFIIEGADSMQHVFSARHDEIKGTDDKKMTLKQAIQSLGENVPPKINVNFVRLEKNGTKSTYKFKAWGEEGPASTWAADGQNKLATIQSWIEMFQTDRGKGIIPVWNPMNCGKPTLDLLEDPSEDCDESRDCSGSIGTYIVNGGKHSPVISFNANLNYVESFSGLSTPANTGGASTGETTKGEKKCETQTKETGIQQSIPDTKQGRDAFGANANVKEAAKAQAAYIRANLVPKEPIRGELRIQGDPREEFVHPKLMISRRLSLIYINPFSILGNGNECGDWLAVPGCNEELSNRNWMIMGASHEIKEGSFTTTLQLQLVAPGVTAKANEPFGGPGSGGYVPRNAC